MCDSADQLKAPPSCLIFITIKEQPPVTSSCCFPLVIAASERKKRRRTRKKKEDCGIMFADKAGVENRPASGIPEANY